MYLSVSYIYLHLLSVYYLVNCEPCSSTTRTRVERSTVRLNCYMISTRVMAITLSIP